MTEDKLSILPGREINVSSRNTLARFLDPKEALRSDANFARDYRGLAEQMNFQTIDVLNFQGSDSATLRILEKWEKQSDATAGQLLSFLKLMNRWDVVEEVQHLLERDAEDYRKRLQKERDAEAYRISLQNKIQPKQDPEITLCRPHRSQMQEDCNALTCDDSAQRKCIIYDAYLCYADENEDDAMVLAERLESQYGFKLCILCRDSLAGHNIHSMSMQLIKERCRRVLILLSPEFWRSPACEFQASFAASVGIEESRRIVIPIVLSPCELPSMWNYVSKIDFTKPNIKDWTWGKLIKSLRVVPSQSTPSTVFISPNECHSCSSSSVMSPVTSTPYSCNPSVEFPSTLDSASSDSKYSVPAITSSFSSLGIASDVTVSDSLNTYESPITSRSENKKTKSPVLQMMQNFIKGSKTHSKASTFRKEHFPLNSVSSSSNVTSGFYSLSSSNLESIQNSAKCHAVNIPH